MALGRAGFFFFYRRSIMNDHTQRECSLNEDNVSPEKNADALVPENRVESLATGNEESKNGDNVSSDKNSGALVLGNRVKSQEIDSEENKNEHRTDMGPKNDIQARVSNLQHVALNQICN